MPFKNLILNRLNRMNGHMREVLKGAIIAFVLRLVGAAAAFALNVVIGRMLGAGGAGLYFLALSVASFTAILAQLGLRNTLLRFISSAAAKEDEAQIRGVFAQGIKLAGMASIALAALVAATAGFSADYVFDKPELASPLRWMSFAIITFSMMTLLAESLKGLKQIAHSMLVTGVIYPLVALVVIWPLASFAGPAGASMAYVVGTGVAALTGLYWWRNSTGAGVATPIPSAQLWDSARPLLLTNLIVRGVIPMAPMFFIGAWGDAADAGVFGAATRLALLASFFLAAVNTAVAPKFSELYTKGEMKMLGHVTRRFALGITLATSPLFLVLFFAGDWVMGLFGPEFTRGGTVLAILAAGQLVSAMSGSVGFLLMMSGHEKDVRNAALFATVVMGVLAVALIPSYNLIGAAIAAAGAVIGTNVFSAVMVYRRLHIIVFPFLKG